MEVTCRGQKLVMSPEQVFGFFLRKLKTYFEKDKMFSNQIVLSVPTYATNVER